MTQTKPLPSSEWESLCDGCGACCRVSPDSDIACPGLDTSSNRCTVYEKREKVHPCVPVTPDNVLILHHFGVLPDTCAYVRHAKGQPQLEPAPYHVLRPYSEADAKAVRQYESRRREWKKHARLSR